VWDCGAEASRGERHLEVSYELPARSTLLRATGAELKVMQELMRHSTIRVTLDTYTQAVTTEKRAAQTAVLSLFVTNKKKRAA